MRKKISLKRFSIFIKGMAMGVADIIPGVSGGTIAIITGIYEELLKTLNNLDLNLLKKLIKGDFNELNKEYNLNFLFALLTGIFSSIIILSHSITYLIIKHPISLWSFFFGIILSGIIVLIKKINNWNFKNFEFIFSSKIYLMVFGCTIAFIIQIVNPSYNQPTHIYLFFCGMLSITAMLLPGISGAYILVLLGTYETMLNTFKEVIKFNSDYFLNFFSFATGALISIKLFSKFLSWAYDKYKDNTLSCLVGFMIGSLPSLWPWKIESSSENIFFNTLYIPKGYFSNIEFNKGLIFITIGFITILILEYLSIKNAKAK